MLLCPEQSYAKLIVLSGSTVVSLSVFGKTLFDMVEAKPDDEITEYMLLELPVFTSINYNSDNNWLCFIFDNSLKTDFC